MSPFKSARTVIFNKKNYYYPILLYSLTLLSFTMATLEKITLIFGASFTMKKVMPFSMVAS
jgi:hypothetical protein